MNKVLNDITPLSLITVIEENLVELFSLFRNWGQAEVYDGSDIFCTITDVPFPLFNSILRARLAPDDADGIIEAVISNARLKNVPILWWTGPNTQPSDLGEYLKKYNFIYIGDSPGMAIDLLNLNKQFQPLPELTIKTVDDPESLRTWSKVLARGFDMPEFAGNAFYNFYSSAGLGEDSPARHYIGWLDGEPVATSSLFFGAGVAGIYNLATIPGARRQGGGSSTIMKPLQEARKMGYRAGILQSSEMGVSVYRRLGFREYCRLSHFVWSIDSK